MPKEAPTTAVDAVKIRFALKYLEEEHETLLALAIALQNQLEPNHQTSPDDCHHTTAWRLSQVLHARITDASFINNMRELMGQTTEQPATA